MVTDRDPEDLRRSSLEHLWMSSGDWVTMAEEGGPTIVMEGKGVKFTDSEGNTLIDGLAGYGSVTHITASFGLFAASEILNLIATG